MRNVKLEEEKCRISRIVDDMATKLDKIRGIFMAWHSEACKAKYFEEPTRQRSYSMSDCKSSTEDCSVCLRLKKSKSNETLLAARCIALCLPVRSGEEYSTPRLQDVDVDFRFTPAGVQQCKVSFKQLIDMILRAEKINIPHIDADQVLNQTSIRPTMAELEKQFTICMEHLGESKPINNQCIFVAIEILIQSLRATRLSYEHKRRKIPKSELSREDAAAASGNKAEPQINALIQLLSGQYTVYF